MKAYRVILSPKVKRQISRQTQYISRDSVDNAVAWERRLRAAIIGIADSPGYAIDDRASDKLGKTVHKYTFERTYIVHYTLNESQSVIEVINFRHGAREPRAGEP